MSSPQKLNPEQDAETRSQDTWLGRLGFVLRRHEQLTLFAIFAGCVLLLSGYFLQLHWMHGSQIDIDEMDFQATSYSVDLNQADWPELANIPNIGEKLAKAIVNYRMQNGGFDTVDEVTEVPGIGPAKLDAMRDYLLPLNPKHQDHSTSHLDSK